MSNLKQPWKDQYTESEAAAALGVTLSRLHQLLDQHVFTGSSNRPDCIEFTASDLVLLSFWNKGPKPTSARRVIQMPKRK